MWCSQIPTPTRWKVQSHFIPLPLRSLLPSTSCPHPLPLYLHWDVAMWLADKLLLVFTINLYNHVASECVQWLKFVSTHKRKLTGFIHSKCTEIISVLISMITIENLLNLLTFTCHCLSSMSMWQIKLIFDLDISIRRDWTSDKVNVPWKKNFWCRRRDWCFCCGGEKEPGWVQTPAVDGFPNKEKKMEEKRHKLALRKWTQGPRLVWNPPVD